MYNRPTGVTILAALVFLGGAWAICFATLGFAWSPIAAIFGDAAWGEAIYNLVRGVFYVVLGIGLFNLKPWARIGAIAVSGIHLVYNLLALFTPWGVDWIGVVISVIIIVYLLNKDIAYTFKG